MNVTVGDQYRDLGRASVKPRRQTCLYKRWCFTLRNLLGKRSFFTRTSKGHFFSFDVKSFFPNAPRGTQKKLKGSTKLQDIKHFLEQCPLYSYFQVGDTFIAKEYIKYLNDLGFQIPSLSLRYIYVYIYNAPR